MTKVTKKGHSTTLCRILFCFLNKKHYFCPEMTHKGNKKIRDTLIVQYLYLTKYVVNRVKVSLPITFSEEDITSYGVEGLIDAIEKFTPDKGARFETYALMRIRGNIIDKIRSQDFLPRSARKKIKDVKQAQEELRQKFGRAATSSEVG